MDDELITAAGANDLETVKQMLENGAKETSLAAMEAIEKGHLEMVKFLFRQIQTIDTVFYIVDDGLIYAAGNGDREMVDLMLKHGATRFDDAINAARSCGHPAIVDHLHEKQLGFSY